MAGRPGGQAGQYVDDPVLGRLARVAGTRTYSVRLATAAGPPGLGGTHVELWFDGEDGPIGVLVGHARRVWERVRHDEPGIRASVAARVARHARTRAPVGPDEVVRRLALTGVRVFADGTAELGYHADGLFGRHGLVVTLDEGGMVIDADVAG